MTEKCLGKIISAEFGTYNDYPFLIGLQLGFQIDGDGVSDGGKYTINHNKECIWKADERNKAFVAMVENVVDILEKAKVNYVSQLIGKPVVVIIENRTFKDFRILTEVL